jgi:hypothetical protein
MPSGTVEARKLLSLFRLEKDIASISLLHCLKFPTQNASLGRFHFISLQFNCRYYLYVGVYKFNNLFAQPTPKVLKYKLLHRIAYARSLQVLVA